MITFWNVRLTLLISQKIIYCADLISIIFFPVHQRVLERESGHFSFTQPHWSIAQNSKLWRGTSWEMMNALLASLLCLKVWCCNLFQHVRTFLWTLIKMIHHHYSTFDSLMHFFLISNLLNIAEEWKTSSVVGNLRLIKNSYEASDLDRSNLLFLVTSFQKIVI